MPLLLTTCADYPDGTDDDRHLVEALRGRGARPEVRRWDAIEPQADCTVLMRSPWDYFQRAAEFSAWLDALEAAGARVLNPLPVLRWNMDKAYLRELAAAGLALPATRWLDAPTPTTVRAAMAEAGWTRAVLKPRVSGGAWGTHLLDADTDLTDDMLAPAQASGAVLQEFLPEIQGAGELSVIFLGGRYSHAVRKTAAPGDFRVQSDFGGAVAPAEPKPETLVLAARAHGATPASCLYARVDIVETERGPLLMELEVLEPELFFRVARPSAGRLAEAVLAAMA
ncbi:MAG: hypothetical protein NW201_05270 [Gemmatimonadales bacterium]|nr:hypothetical protein [Gemmatimonadales bacterium]